MTMRKLLEKSETRQDLVSGLRVRTGVQLKISLLSGDRILHLRLIDSGENLSSTPYRIEGTGITRNGTTDGGGILMEPIPGSMTSVTLTINPDHKPFVFKLSIQDALSTEQTEGIQNRLQNLGYNCPVTGQMEEKTSAAIRLFKQHNDLTDNEEITDDFCSLLRTVYGS